LAVRARFSWPPALKAGDPERVGKGTNEEAAHREGHNLPAFKIKGGQADKTALPVEELT
jgi:hypothetical protein